MAKRQRSSPRPSGSLVDSMFGRTGLARQAREWRALYAWHRLAGPRLGRHTRAERVLGTTLLVRVATSPWANELSYMRAELLEKLRADPAAVWLTELRFTVGPLDGLPLWDDDQPALPPPEPLRIPSVTPGPVVEALLRVTDPELRAALGDLFARSQSARAIP